METVGLNPSALIRAGPAATTQLVWRGHGSVCLGPGDCLRLVANDACTEFIVEWESAAADGVVVADAPAVVVQAEPRLSPVDPNDGLATSNPSTPQRGSPTKRARLALEDPTAASVRCCELGAACIDMTRSHILACAHPGSPGWQAQCVHPAKLVARELPSVPVELCFQLLQNGAVVCCAPVDVYVAPAPLAVAAFDLDETLIVRARGQHKFTATGYPQELRLVSERDVHTHTRIRARILMCVLFVCGRCSLVRLRCLQSCGARALRLLCLPTSPMPACRWCNR